MLVKGMFTQLSGSFGGLTGSRNSGGLYIRARAVPVNPNSPAQVAARQATSTLVDRWVNTLTQTQRDEWELYALNVPVTGPLGDPREISGIAMYIRLNQPRERTGASPADDGPVIFTDDSFTPITIATDIPNGEIDVSFDDADAWANEVDGHLIIQIGTSQNASINFFNGPFRFADNIDGDPIPPTSPAAIVNPFPMAIGQRIFVRARSSRADARISPASIVNVIAA